MELANDELDTVLELDVETIKKMVSHLSYIILLSLIECLQVGRLHLYYGENDWWSPLSYRENLLKEVPELGTDNARIDTTGMSHAFVVDDGESLGKIVGDWIKEGKGL